MNRYPRIAVLGATGAVGQEFIRLFEERNFKFSSLKLLASARSAGKKVFLSVVKSTLWKKQSRSLLKMLTLHFLPVETSARFWHLKL